MARESSSESEKEDEYSDMGVGPQKHVSQKNYWTKEEVINLHSNIEG